MVGERILTPRLVKRLPRGIVGLAVVLVLVQFANIVVFVGPGGLLVPSNALGVVLTAGFAVPVVAGGLWLERRDVSPDRYPRVSGWCLGFSAVVLAINLVMISAWTTGSFYQDFAWAVQAATMGAAGGIIFGGIEARSIERAREAERALVRSEQLDAQREWLEYLNSLLRHEVLNTANVIVGYSELLLSQDVGDEQHRDRIERIARQSRKMTDVIQDVRLLIQATSEGDDFEPVDLVDVLERETLALEDRFDDVVVETDLPDRAPVEADEIVSRIFSNLLANAVEHNDADAPRVSISASTDHDTVTVRIADNGPGIPESELDALFERNQHGDHGLGLYLVERLLVRYGGTIEVSETGPTGTTFVVELPRASERPPAAASTAVMPADAA